MNRKRIRVVVTQQDIDTSQWANSKHCPIAQALRRQGFRFVEVTGEFACVGQTEIASWDYEMSAKASAFVDLFDRLGRKHVQPAVFVLRPFESTVNHWK